MWNKIILDADFCIKLGQIEKYPYLERLLRAITKEAYIHEVVYDEVKYPQSAKAQIDNLIHDGKMKILRVAALDPLEALVYHGIYERLAKVMINPLSKNKNRGEVSSLAMAKMMEIPYFVTDEKELQKIVDKILNTGENRISCIRIEDIIKKIKLGEIDGFGRKDAKMMWVLSGKDKEFFDREIWMI